jgi:putative transcription antitermination factor YqgF
MSISSSKKPNTSHFLGVDFGKAKIGLAIADSETKIAFGYGILKNSREVFREIGEIIGKERIDKVIVGGEGENFGELLEKRLKVPVEIQSEIFSTQLAERLIKEKGMKKIKKYDDQEAARIILQSWLDKRG